MVRKPFKFYFINLSRFSTWKNRQQTSEECDVRILTTTINKTQHVDFNENLDFGESETTGQYGKERLVTKISKELENVTEFRHSTVNGEKSFLFDEYILQIYRNLMMSGHLEELPLRKLVNTFKGKPGCSMVDVGKPLSKSAVPCFSRQTVPVQYHFSGMQFIVKPCFSMQSHFLNTRGKGHYFKKRVHPSHNRFVHTSSACSSRSSAVDTSKTERSPGLSYSRSFRTETHARRSMVTESTLPQGNEDDVIITGEDQSSVINVGQNALKREWEYTKYGHRHMSRGEPGFNFTVMSYNILAQNLLEDNPYLYEDCEPDFLHWPYRRQQILCEVKTYLPDILCLQEVDKEHYESFFKPHFNDLGYKGEYIKRSGNKQDGCATFYQAKKFTPDQVTPLEYFCGNDSLLDRDNVALVLRLKPVQKKYSDVRICVGNTHILYNPGRGDIKLAQLMMLLAELDKCSYNSVVSSDMESYHPMILCGDFNSEPYSHLYNLLARGHLYYEGLCSHLISGQSEYRRRNPHYLEKNFFPSSLRISDQCQHIQLVKKRHDLEAKTEIENLCSFYTQGSGYLWHRLNLLSAYTHRVERLGYREAEVTTHHGRADCTVDYIFYNVLNKHVEEKSNKLIIKNVREGKLKLTGRLGLMSKYELSNLGAMPNKFIPSDHLCLLAKFHI